MVCDFGDGIDKNIINLLPKRSGFIRLAMINKNRVVCNFYGVSELRKFSLWFVNTFGEGKITLKNEINYYLLLYLAASYQ